jgi:hypothetical protein
MRLEGLLSPHVSCTTGLDIMDVICPRERKQKNVQRHHGPQLKSMYRTLLLVFIEKLSSEDHFVMTRGS